MKFLKFPYQPYPVEDPTTDKITGEIFRPTIPVRLSYRHQFFKYPFDALVDSGSDRNLFPADIGNVLKIRIKTKNPKIIEGIGKNKIIAYTHDITILVAGRRIKTFIDFSDEHPTPILGRIGFFNHFKKVIFDERAKEVLLGY